jgi:hypothetical protein
MGSTQLIKKNKLVEYLGEFGGAFFISFFTIVLC